jgi:tetratricopeptide (TPR) repeat protein
MGPENNLAVVEFSTSRKPSILFWGEELRSFRLFSSSYDHLPAIKLFADKDDSQLGKGALTDSVIWDGRKYTGSGAISFESADKVDASYIDVVLSNQDKIRQIADSQVEIEHKIGLNYFKTKNFSKAIEQLQFSGAILPVRESTIPLFNDLGFFLEEANRPAEAISVLEKVIAYDPSRTPAYLNLADAYRKAGDKAKARENYKKYADLMDGTGKASKVPARVREFLKD